MTYWDISIVDFILSLISSFFKDKSAPAIILSIFNYISWGLSVVFADELAVEIDSTSICMAFLFDEIFYFIPKIFCFFKKKKSSSFCKGQVWLTFKSSKNLLILFSISKFFAYSAENISFFYSLQSLLPSSSHFCKSYKFNSAQLCYCCRKSNLLQIFNNLLWLLLGYN